MSDGKSIAGLFPVPEGHDEDGTINKILTEMLGKHKDADWLMSGGYIAVRCWTDPETYNIVVAKIVHNGRNRALS